MASEQSYAITLSNNKSEQAGIRIVLASDPHLSVPSGATRKRILDVLGIDKKFSRAFDLIRTEQVISIDTQLTSEQIRTLTLLELKTTKKKLPRNPEGFFFGATQNEFDLANILGDRYVFCFVSLHPESMSCAQLTLKELLPRIKTKRVQFQINL